MTRVAVFGEIYSPNVGDGIIFDCIAWGLAQHGVEALACDLSLRTGYEDGPKAADSDDVSHLRSAARFFVRRSLSLRRAITVVKWIGGERRRFIAAYERSIRESDAVIVGGGQIIVDRQLGFPLRIATIVSLAKKYQKKIAVFSCGADRTQGSVARAIFGSLARSACYISARDETSRAFFESLGPSLTVNCHPDVGFLVSSVHQAHGTAADGVIGVNVMPHSTMAAFTGASSGADGQEQDRKAWEALIGQLLSRGYRVQIMTNGDPLDYDAADGLYEVFREESRVRLMPRPMRPVDLAEQMQGIPALVASRMHAGIVAYSYGKRVLPIVWDKKVVGVWQKADPAVAPLVSLQDIDLIRRTGGRHRSKPL